MIAEDYEFAGLERLGGQTLAEFQPPANNNEEGVWLAPQAVRRLLAQNPGHAELLRAFYALEKEILTRPQN
ncbi:MAG: hypothetical protein H6868_03585 [Rhodospirillales bacterium]|nr:hypothetical protein [Rhodospirillales bacterium]